MKEGERTRFKVRSLMRELALVTEQPGSQAYKKAAAERPRGYRAKKIQRGLKRYIIRGVYPLILADLSESRRWLT